ncbi:MAG: TfoX/Sxy family protein [Leptolyngbyaceae cyanobacterium MO_188.B28]|nr:TfoX/Sxy family protein [Leptolyngbyaceae cyanobacterium MO_188.B28]
MTQSSDKQRFRDQVVSRLNTVAPVTARGMFGGYGLYLEGVMFALIAYKTLYFKVDDENRADYLAAETGPFIYNRNGKLIEMSYYQLPDAVFEDVEALAEWVQKAHAAARRSKQKKSKRKKRLAD